MMIEFGTPCHALLEDDRRWKESHLGAQVRL
jgi:hypothetical protein